MTRFNAYIDESGNHDLMTEKNGASKYFLVLAVIVPETDAPDLERQVDLIRAKYFGSGEIKSSSIKEDRRARIINDLTPLAFSFYAVAVDKARIAKDSGLQHKQSFIKFVNGRLYRELFQHLPNVSVFADGHGSPEFIESFRKYIKENHKPDLFSSAEVEIVDSQSDVLVQLADFLVGTAAKLYENKVTPKFRTTLMSFLRLKRVRIDEWPPRFEIDHESRPHSDDRDSAIFSMSIRSAAQFLSEHAADTETETRIQHATLSYLLFQAKFSDHGESVPTQELLDHLKSHGIVDINKHYIRSNVVSKLRDRNVVIASSPRGYKIPTSYADLMVFAELVEGIVCPLLARLERAHTVFNFGSGGTIDVLAESRFRKLRSMLNLDV